LTARQPGVRFSLGRQGANANPVMGNDANGGLAKCTLRRVPFLHRSVADTPGGLWQSLADCVLSGGSRGIRYDRCCTSNHTQDESYLAR
jgi:hypothetical protein